MKKFIALLVAAVLIVSMVGVLTAFAGASISGNSEVYAGKTYKYTVKVSADGIYMMGNVSCGGVFSGSSVQFDGGSGAATNQSMSASVTITVTVSASAKPGDTGTISIDHGSYSYYDESGVPQESGISGSKTATVVVKSSSPSTSSGSHSTHAPATPTPAPTGWGLAAIDVPALAQGGQYDMQTPADAIVPTTLLASLKEKQGVLNVDFGTYTCTIDGAALGTLPEGITGIDLGLTLEKDEALSTAAGGVDAYQLHFKHAGDLPGRFTFRFKAEQNQPGDIVYLYYYYNESGVVEGKQQCVVDDEGYITVDIYHCSSYFVSNTLIEGAAGILTQPEPVATPELTPAPTVTPVAVPDKPATETDGLTVSALGPVEQWFGIPYAPLIAALIAAMLVSMLLTMMITRSGLFRRRPKAATAGADTMFAPETTDAAIVPDDDDKPDDDLE